MPEQKKANKIEQMTIQLGTAASLEKKNVKTAKIAGEAEKQQLSSSIPCFIHFIRTQTVSNNTQKKRG